MADHKTHIGKYDVISTIGRGGMGVIYKATDPLLDRVVAIKMMTGGFANDPELLKRFYREAKSTASLRHPNIVTVYDVGDQEGEPYLVMEFLDGESLDAIINSQRNLGVLEKIDYIVQVCRGLQYAHERNIIHRDIKPANIMVVSDGLTKIVDFGIARMGNDLFTRPGQVMGSIHYMSPEQIRERDLDTRTDLFATGAVLYQLLTYNLPFKGENVSATLFKIIHDPPSPLSHYLKSYPSDLDTIIERALAKDSGERYQTADELAFDLTQVQLQLKAGLVAELLEKAEVSIEQGGLTRAKEHLLELLKLDPQNQSANERMRALQKSIQDRRRAEQIQQLRKEAEEAKNQQQFEQALRSIEHAIALDHTNPELVNVREDLIRAKSQADFVLDCMNLAQSAYNNSDLDRALNYLDQLLDREPEHPSAVALRHEVSRAIARREVQRQVQTLLEIAHRQIASQQYSGALEVLDQVAELNPNASNLRGLVRLANEGIEQQRHRRLQVLTFEIERLLDRKDYADALAQIEDGLRDIPADPTLLRFKGICEQHRDTAEHRMRVNGRITVARSLLNSGKTEEAIAALQSASDLVGRVPSSLRSSYDDLRAAIDQCRHEATQMRPSPDLSGLGEQSPRRTVTRVSLSDATTEGLGSGPNSPALRATPSNDKTILELTPPEGQILPDHQRDVIGQDQTSSTVIPPQSPSESPSRATGYLPAMQETTSAGQSTFANVPGWQADTLVRVEKQLANFLGPLARVLVKKAASRTKDLDELYTLLAAHLDRDRDRIAFLAGRSAEKGNASQSWTKSQSLRGSSLTSTVHPTTVFQTSQGELTQADIDRATTLLARHLGPIAGVLTKKAARRANSLRALYGLLAEHLENSTERVRFLRDAGFSDL